MSLPSAVDVVSQAFRHARAQIWPFRWSQWWRLALVGMAAGEFGSNGGCNQRLPTGGNIPGPSGLGGFGGDLIQLALVVALGMVLVLLLWLLAVYVGSVCRFILIDAIVRKRCGSLRQAWAMWRPHGRRFFRWQIAYQLSTFAVFIVVIGVPCGLAFLAGWFSPPQDHLPALILGGVVLLLVFIALVCAAVIVYVLTKDFVAPLMALEELTAGAAWARLLVMMRAEKTGYLLYLLVKLVLSFVVGVAMAMALVALMLPLILLVVGVVIQVGPDGEWSRAAIGSVVAVGGLAVVAIVLVLAFVSVPLVVFFPAYGLYFLAPRYPALAQWMASAADAPPSPVEAV